MFYRFEFPAKLARNWNYCNFVNAENKVNLRKRTLGSFRLTKSGNYLPLHAGNY